MSGLVERVRRAYASGHAAMLTDLRSERDFIEGIPRDAAVLAAITDRPRPGFLLIHRPSNMRAHPGQVAFPGGAIDPGEGPVDAALREAWEELGINRDAATVIGPSDVYHTASGYAVTPVLAVIPPDLALQPNPAEVAAWFEAPVDYLFDTANHVERIADWQGRERRYIEIVWEDHSIWGITAAIIANLARRIVL